MTSGGCPECDMYKTFMPSQKLNDQIINERFEEWYDRARPIRPFKDSMWEERKENARDGYKAGYERCAKDMRNK